MGLGPGLLQESLEGSLRPMVEKVRHNLVRLKVVSMGRFESVNMGRFESVNI